MSIFADAKFIATAFSTYYSVPDDRWSVKKPPLYQHTDLVAYDGLPMFAGDFTVTEVGAAKLCFTALGCVRIFINGHAVDVGEMSPGWTNYNKRVQYMEREIGAYLTSGKNRLLAVCSPGWYNGRIAGGAYGDHPPAVLVCIRCGDTVVLRSGGDWRCKVGGRIRTAELYDGEYCDGREPGYEELSLPDTSLEGWNNATVYDYAGQITPLIGPGVVIRRGLARLPERITVSDGTEYDGTYFGKAHFCEENTSLPFALKRGQRMTVDFGQETVGFVRIRVKSAAGTTIKMRYAEFLNDSGDLDRGNDGAAGTVYTVNLRSALGKAYYVTAGDGEEEYRPSFTFFGYRYVEITADRDVSVLGLTAEVIGSDIRETGHIETSDALVNKLISNVLWGQRSNYLSVPTDCPQRDERLGWTGDAQAFSITAAYNADVYGFFRKWMQDVRDTQDESGGYADIVPPSGMNPSADSGAWGDAGIIIPYNLYRIYGDDTMIREHFDSMDRYMNGLVEKYGYAGTIPRYGDWLAYDLCSGEFISSAYFVHDIDLMLAMCEAAGRPDKKAEYTAMRERAYAYFCEHFTADGKLTEHTQCNKIIALAFDLVTGDAAHALADELARQIKENGDRLSCGFLGTYNLCPTLSKWGKDKTAYDLLLQRNEPSWLYSIDQGATTVWERWNSYTLENGFGDVSMNSFNHYAYGAIVEWMYRYMAGIEPIEPGFGRFALRPRIDLRTPEELPAGQHNIRWVKASFASASGLIRSEWSTEKGLTYRCTVPEGTTATLTLPIVAEKVNFDGRELATAPFGENLTLELTAGEHILRQ